jgi:hypothetical protein
MRCGHFANFALQKYVLMQREDIKMAITRSVEFQRRKIR